MNKTAIFTGLGGFALGCLTIFLYQQKAPAPASATVATVPLTKIEPAAKAVQSSPKAADPTSSEPKVKVATSVNGLDSPEHKDIMAQVGKTMKAQAATQLKLRVDERLAALKVKLGLSDEQVLRLRPQVESLIKDASAPMIGEDGSISINMDNMKEQKQKAAAEKLQAEKDLIAQLSPEQLAAYELWKQEESANRVEVKAGQDLASLQSQLSLTAEQKDAAFAAFSKLAGEQGEQGDLLSNPQGFLDGRKARMEAMRPILTPEQMAVYERNAGSNIMSFSVGGTSIDATGVVNSVVIDTDTSNAAEETPAPATKK